MDINRLKWATRRGMLELDLVLLPFLENCFETLSDDDQARFEKLLACQDPDIFDWFMGKAIPSDPGVKIIVDKINRYSRPKG
jgi:antitoxin CptB